MFQIIRATTSRLCFQGTTNSHLTDPNKKFLNKQPKPEHNIPIKRQTIPNHFKSLTDTVRSTLNHTFSVNQIQLQISLTTNRNAKQSATGAIRSQSLNFSDPDQGSSSGAIGGAPRTRGRATGGPRRRRWPRRRRRRGARGAWAA